MVRAGYLSIILLLAAVPVWADEATSSPAQTPTDRGYGQHDACYGDKYEREEDLKTGNERAVEETLKQLLNPGS
tara:strand:+ start:107 stop:328 length:222 start_codon:yes stop_codon:yes gene_type:complete